MKVNPYSTVEYTKPTQVKETQKVELTRTEIISSKDLTPEQKLEKLGIKPWTTGELAENLADKILDGEI